MVDLLFPFVVLCLIAVICVQAIERYLFSQQMHQQQEKLLTAFLSKNATEYSVAVKTEKTPQGIIPESDEVNLSDASDETFSKFIEQQS